jgi:predicted transcriptional regulator
LREKESLREKILKLIVSAGYKGITQRELVGITGVSKGYLSDLIDEFEKKGLVIRYKGPGRTVVVKHVRYTHPVTGKLIRIGLVKSSEYVFMPIMIKKLKEDGYNIEIIFYENVFDLTRSLSRGDVHMAMTPIYTQIAYRGFGAPIKSLKGGVLGGAYMISKEDPEDLKSHEKIYAFSSHLSTMEILTHSLMRSLRTYYQISYYRSVEEIERKIFDIKSGEIISLWEPHVSKIMRIRGDLKIIPYRELFGEYHCCTLAIHENLMMGLTDYIEKIYIDSLARVRKEIDRAVGSYADIINADKNEIMRSIDQYVYVDYIDEKILDKILSAGGGYIISKEFVRDLFI